MLESLDRPKRALTPVERRARRGLWGVALVSSVAAVGLFLAPALWQAVLLGGVGMGAAYLGAAKTAPGSLHRGERYGSRMLIVSGGAMIVAALGAGLHLEPAANGGALLAWALALSALLFGPMKPTVRV